MPEKKLEILIDEKWEVATEQLWKSWSGLRRLDGEEHHGPVYDYNTGKLFRKIKRECPCGECQLSVDPEFRMN